MTTLINDEFDEGEPRAIFEIHHIVYGSNGFTDALSPETIQTLLGVGAIVLDRMVGSYDWQTRIYVSTQGRCG